MPFAANKNVETSSHVIGDPFWLASASTAALQAAQCHGPELVAPSELSDRWRAAVDDVRRQIAAGDDLEACARVELVEVGASVIVTVRLPDDRSTLRRVDEPAYLSSVVVSLLVTSGDGGLRVAVAPEAPWPERSEGLPAQLPVHIEVGAGPSGRLEGGGVVYGGGGALAFVDVARAWWVVGVDARWGAAYGPLRVVPPSGFTMDAFFVGAHAGFRTRSGAALLDAALALRAGIITQDADSTGDALGGSVGDVRVGAFVRVSTPATSRARFFALAEGDAAPSRVHSVVRLQTDMPPLPTWGAGLAVGATWEAL